jgi:hypothetical protein
VSCLQDRGGRGAVESWEGACTLLGLENALSHVISYGSPDQGLMDLAASNFTEGRFANRSFCTTPVELLSNDGLDSVISHGTGFYWHHAGTDFVVTNWHVLSGRNPFTGDRLSEKGFFPKKVRIYGWSLMSRGDELEMKRPSWTVDIGDDGLEIMRIPPEVNGHIVDIAAIPITMGSAMEKDLDEAGQQKFGALEPRVNLMGGDRISSQAGDDCMIIGYPLAQYTGLMLPVWKRGSLATDTSMAVDQSPAFLVDAATSPAMSGSPIFRRVSGLLRLDRTTGIIAEATGYEFVGVYAGRLESKELDRVNVGYGWFANHVEEAVLISLGRWLKLAMMRNLAKAGEATSGEEDS